MQDLFMKIYENNWCSYILNLLDEINMENKFYSHEIIDIAEVQNRYYEINCSEWCNGIASKPKLRLYMNYKNHFYNKT